MLAAWMLYAMAISGVVGCAALALERAALSVRRPVRGIWASAFLVTLSLALVPPLGFLFEGAGTPPERQVRVTLGVAEPLSPPLLDLIPASFPVDEDGVLARISVPLGWSWLLMVMVLAARFGVDARRLYRNAEKWKGVELPEGRVFLSEELGPAVVGFLPGRMVVPRWCLALPEATRGLVLAHESEHIRARDTLLVGSALGVALAMPWNPGFWWFLRRLRDGVELDCDARVMRRFPDQVRAYGELLLDVGARAPRTPLAYATFSEHPSTLGRRIHMLTHGDTPRSTRRALIFTVAGGLLVLAACLVPGPDRATELLVPELEEPRYGSDLGAVSIPQGGDEGPHFTPFTTAPAIQNVDQIRERLDEMYPPLLRDAGIGGVVLLHLHLDETGRVTNVLVFRSSGHQALDRAALQVVPDLRFSPAMNREEAVAVWIVIPMRFADTGASTDRESDVRELDVREGDAGAPTPPDEPMSASPRFTPFTAAPEIRDRAALEAALEREYPPLLRDAGIGGRTVVHFFIDDTGKVGNVQITESAGHEAIDAAALRVARTVEFVPARNGDRAVPVWVQIPITFQRR